MGAGHYHDKTTRNTISKQTRAAMKGAGLDGMSFHDLRHTAASWMVQSGVSLFDVQQILGHSTPVMTQRYAHLRPEHLRDSIRALDTWMDICDRVSTRVMDGPLAQSVEHLPFKRSRKIDAAKLPRNSHLAPAQTTVSTASTV